MLKEREYVVFDVGCPLRGVSVAGGVVGVRVGVGVMVCGPSGPGTTVVVGVDVVGDVGLAVVGVVVSVVVSGSSGLRTLVRGAQV